ncbi:MAG: hypothetical protein ACT4QG_13205 [Sporichthyaceae bacterium]
MPLRPHDADEPYLDQLSLLGFLALPPSRSAPARARIARREALAVLRGQDVGAPTHQDRADLLRAAVLGRAFRHCARPALPTRHRGHPAGSSDRLVRNLPPAARAARALLGVDGLAAPRVERILALASVPDPATCVALGAPPPGSLPLLVRMPAARRFPALGVLGAICAGALAVTLALQWSDAGFVPDPRIDPAPAAAAADRPTTGAAAARIAALTSMPQQPKRAARPRARKATEPPEARALREARRILDQLGVEVPYGLLR